MIQIQIQIQFQFQRDTHNYAGLRHDVLAASRWRGSWEAGCQQLTAEMGVND